MWPVNVDAHILGKSFEGRNALMDVDEMIRQILNAIDEIEGMQCRDQWSNPEWTRKIKTALCAKLEYEMAMTFARPALMSSQDCGEWLYDVCWLKYGCDMTGVGSG